MPKKLSKLQISRMAAQFVACQTNNKLEQLLQMRKMQLSLTAFNPQYYYFEMKKQNGGIRKIEAPEHNLKRIQRKINDYLQYIYYTGLTDAAYGFVINPRKQKPKNIVSNATRHTGNDYMLNIDFDDFFHQISQKEVFDIFKKKPFCLSKNTANTLAKICTNKGRLPMGAPTSPALSNFACINLDKELQLLAIKNNITYTRFVDDLTFSSKKPITTQHFQKIQEITNKHKLRIEHTKTKWYGKNQTKIVTGLLVGDNIDIPKDYYYELNKDIERLQKAVEVHIITGQVHRTGAIKKFKQQIMGKINFIAVVLGYNSPVYDNYLQKYERAINPPEKNELSIRWMRFSNYSHL